MIDSEAMLTTTRWLTAVHAHTYLVRDEHEEGIALVGVLLIVDAKLHPVGVQRKLRAVDGGLVLVEQHRLVRAAAEAAMVGIDVADVVMIAQQRAAGHRLTVLVEANPCDGARRRSKGRADAQRRPDLHEHQRPTASRLVVRQGRAESHRLSRQWEQAVGAGELTSWEQAVGAGEWEQVRAGGGSR